MRGKDGSPEIGARIEVLAGDGVTPIGQGEYLGEATVYFIRMPDGSLKSMQNAEEMPPQEWLDHLKDFGITLERMDDNLKIRLDNGKIVYGCQVWWREVKPDPLKKIIVPGDYPG